MKPSKTTSQLYSVLMGHLKHEWSGPLLLCPWGALISKIHFTSQYYRIWIYETVGVKPGWRLHIYLFHTELYYHFHTILFFYSCSLFSFISNSLLTGSSLSIVFPHNDFLQRADQRGRPLPSWGAGFSYNNAPPNPHPTLLCGCVSII